MPGRYTEVAFIQGWPLFRGGLYSGVAFKRGSTVVPLYAVRHDRDAVRYLKSAYLAVGVTSFCS